MTAEAVSPIPHDTIAPPPRVQDVTSGAQFSALLGSPQVPVPGSNTNAPAAPATNAAQSGVTLKGNPVTSAGSTGTTSNASNGSQTPLPNTNKKPTDNGNNAAVAVVVPLPLPVPLPIPLTLSALLPAAAASATTAATALAGTTGATLPLPRASAAATLLSGTALSTTATVSLPVLPNVGPSAPLPAKITAAAVATGAALLSAGATATLGVVAANNTTDKSTASATPAGASTPTAAGIDTTPLPTVASQLGANVAAGAQKLVSQPRVALASLTPEQAKAAVDSPASSHTAQPLDTSHDLPKPVAAPVTDGGDKVIAAAVKEGITVAPVAGNDPTKPIAADATAVVANATPDTNGGSTPQIAAAVPAVAPTSATIEPAPAPALPVLPHPLAEQVAVNLTQAVKDGVDHIKIQLQPAELGAIDVKLNVSHEGRVEMVVSADRSDTLNLLRQDSSGLTQALRDAGLQADSSSLSFNLRGGNQSNQQATTAGSGANGDSSLKGIDEAGVATPVIATLRRHAGALDIHV